MRPEDLPIYRQRQRILEVVASNSVSVVESPTGSGKTTQLPIILHNAGYSQSGLIGVTQPRRIATISVSDYIAKQLEVEVPGLVGYKMRFEDKTDATTRIKVMTDGILLQELKADLDLSKYSFLMVDEAHERSLNIDFVLGMLKNILRRRPDFKVLISSATINAEVFSEYFDECPIVRVDAQVYPVDLIYKPLENSDYLIEDIASIVNNYLKQNQSGDLLIFLPGERLIKECVASLQGLSASRRMTLLPLYGRLSKEEQERVFIPAAKGKQKIIVATNIAETSVTIDGIRGVIDSGLAKLNFYNPRTFTSSLIEQSVSRASCNQRKGRSGRTAPGICYRLYSQRDYETRSLFTQEEILRTDLSEVVLRMAELGIRDFESFDFLSPPEKKDILSAIETLKMLDAIDGERKLTSTGELMVRFPLLPRHSRILAEAILRFPNVLEESIIAATFLSSNTPFLLPPGEELEARRAHHTFQDKNGDFISYLKLIRAFVASKKRDSFCEGHYLDLKIMNELVNIKNQLSEIIGEMGLSIGSGGPVEDYLCAVACGLIQFVCTRSGRAYKSLTADQIHIHPGSVMFRETPRFIVAGEIVKTSRMFARSVSPLSKRQLSRVSPLFDTAFTSTGLRNEPRKSEPKKTRETTWKVNIGREEFQLVPYKGKKKLVLLPWERLLNLIQMVQNWDLSHLSSLRCKVTYKNMEILVGMRLPSILAIAPNLDLTAKIFDKPPVLKNMSPHRNTRALLVALNAILRICRTKKGSNRLGFITLNSEDDEFWLSCTRGYQNALSASLNSLEMLSDQLNADSPQDLTDLAGKTYRKLSNLIVS